MLKKYLNKVKVVFIKHLRLRAIFKILRAIFILLFIFITSLLITKTLTPSDYTIRLIRECSDETCKKIKTIDSDRNTTIESEIGALSSILERLDFFARFTFLRFNFQTTNQSQFNLVVTEPHQEEKIDIKMQCNIDGRNVILYPNSGLIFKQQASIENIIKELEIIQDVLITCNPASQHTGNMIKKPLEVAPEALVQLIYDEEKYHLKFLPDKWNLPLTLLQMFVVTGIILAAYYEILKFIKRGLNG